MALLLVTLTLSSCSKPTFNDQSGKGWALGNTGRWAVINYWATWCAPCIKEIPELNELAKEYQDKLDVFGINYDQLQGAELDEAMAQLKIEFPVLINDPSVHFGYTIPNALPTTFIINPQGQIHKTLIGPQTLQQLKDAIK